jgi:serine/threonine protein kinase/tetratricopeptide (TPR) repeat protein
MAQSTPDLIALFLQALERPPGPQRAAYLDDACRGDAQLRTQVDELIDAHVRASRFLGWAAGVTPGDPGTTLTGEETATQDASTSRPSPAGTANPETRLEFATGPAPRGATAPRPFTEGPGTRIGPYTLLQKIGEGGMGAVYRAEQAQPIRRQVALKVIKPGMDTDLVVARFEAERQALALMDHPNIAKVFDAGATESGRPYFVMELVDGIPITQYCDQARLAMNERLVLFMTVCQAIQHAHQKGIIHRDIKPSNVLVTRIDGQPVPKVIDFGVAKAIDQRLTERTLCTQFGTLVGTLEYMSPEQAELSGANIDTRSDIYALGVLLYELLTGTTPLGQERVRESAFAEVLRRIREEEPPRPSTRLSDSRAALASIAACRDVEPARLARLVQGDLDWIVMKALEKERSRRYATAFELAQDIQRHLAGDPVEAGPPSAAYRLGKFARKHRAAVVTAAAFVALLAVGLVVSTVLMLRARSAEWLANRRLDDLVRANAATTQALAETRQAQTEARAEADKAQAVNAFLTEDLLTQAEPAHTAAENHVSLLEILDRAAGKVGDRFAGQPEVEDALRRTIAGTYHGLAAWEKAERQWRTVLAAARGRLGGESREALTAQGQLVHILRHRGQLDAELLEMAKSATEGLARVLGPDHPDALDSRGNLALAYLDAGRTAEAIALHEANLKLRTAKHGPDHPFTLTSRGNLAMAYLLAGRTAEAIALDEETLKLRTAKLGPDHPETLTSGSNLAQAYLASGRTAEAIALHEEILKLRTSKLGPDHPETLVSRNNLANAYLGAGRTAVATALHEGTLKLMTATLGPDHPHTLKSRTGVAVAYLRAGRIAEAIALHEETLKVWTAKLGPDHPETLTSGNFLAQAYLAGGRTAEAIAIWKAMLPAARQTFGPAHSNTLLFTNRLAAAQESLGHWADAFLLRRESIVLRRKTSPPDSPMLAGDLAGLGSNLLEQHQGTEAEPVFRESLKIYEAKQPGDWTTFDTRSLLGASLMGQQNYAQAEPLIVGGYEGLKARAARIPAPARPRLAQAAWRVVALYQAWGQPDKAAQWRAKLGLADLPADVFSP